MTASQTATAGSLRRSILRITAIVVIVVLAAGAFGYVWLGRTGLPQRFGTARIAGLTGPVDVRFDDVGVPHVEAQSTVDLVAALGWLHANDRMTQMELARRAASGRLAELVGGPMVAADRFLREIRVLEAAQIQLNGAGPESRTLLDAYARGVNAWLEAHANDLPPGLVLLGAEPEPWRPVDSMGMVALQAVGLSFLFESETQRASLLEAFDTETVVDFSPGADPLRFADELLAWLEERTSSDGEEVSESGELERGGSNNFAVDGTRTADGHVLVANDPHLELGLPSVWYQVQLRSPDYEAAGMTLPGLPLVVIGQGPEVAWAITNSGLDNNDLFVEDVVDGRYRRGDEWFELERETVEIQVRGGSSVEQVLLATDVGPCSTSWIEGTHASLAWTAYDEQDALETLLGLARATSLLDVRAAIADYVAPAQNLIAGHRDEGLMCTILGRHPDRGRGDGQTPSMGWLPETHWVGLRSQGEQPLATRPDDGLFATANDDPRPAGWTTPFPAEFDVPHRARRAREQLATRRDWTVDRMAELQADATSLFARDVVKASLPATGAGLSPDAGSARALLADWDGSMNVESAAAALYTFYERALYWEIFEDEDERADGIDHGFGYQRRHRMLRALAGETAIDWIDNVSTKPRETVPDVAERALEVAWRRCRDVLGAPARARYGDLHRWTPRHPLGAIPVVGPWIFGAGDYDVPGSNTCLNALSGASTASGILEVGFGPSMRLVMDCADPDRSVACLPGGQSGHPFDPHYADQLDDFVAGRTHALQWTDDAIEAATVSRLEILPAE